MLVVAQDSKTRKEICMTPLGPSRLGFCIALVTLLIPSALLRAGITITVEGGPFDDLGEKIASEIRDLLEQEIVKQGGTAFDVLDLGIIEGTKKPESAVEYLGTLTTQI